MFKDEEKALRKAAKEKGVRMKDGPVVESLLDLFLTKTDTHFYGLCECLDKTGQGFIVKQCLSQKGKRIQLNLNFNFDKQHLLITNAFKLKREIVF